MTKKIICQWCGKKGIDQSFTQSLYDPDNPKDTIDLNFCNASEMVYWRAQFLPDALDTGEKKWLLKKNLKTSQ